MKGLEKQLPDGYELTNENPESITLDSDKMHVIVRYAVKPVKDPHDELKQQYARDVETCATIDGLEPWQLWQVKARIHTDWNIIKPINDLKFRAENDYRRHPHADSIIAYHKCSDANKKRWQFRLAGTNGNWAYAKQPTWQEKVEYRLKPHTISVTLQNGQVLEFPEPVREPLNNGDQYFVAYYDGISIHQWDGRYLDTHWLNLGMIYITWADCQAAHDAIQAILSQRSE